MLTDANGLRDVDALLAAANLANLTIQRNQPKTFEVCQLALQKCKDWADSKGVKPEDLAVYLDADDTQNPWMRESLFNDDPEGLNALIFITMVVGRTAYLAYVYADKQA